MNREQITDKEAIYIMIIFVIGSTLIIGLGAEAKNDAWIAGIVGIIMSIPIILVYSKILTLFPGKDLFDILDIAFGKIFGTIISIMYIWYAFHLGALVIRNFGEFINTVAMPETPILVSMLCLALVCVAAVRSGIEVIGRICAFVFPILLFILIVVQFLVIPKFRLGYIKPFFGVGVKLILRGGFSSFSFPFAETVIFLGVFNSLKKKQSPYKVYLYGVLISGVIIIAISIRNILVLGQLGRSLYFPSYIAVSRISIGAFLQRIEVTVAIVFIFGALIKTSICMLVSCKGIAKLLKLSDYRNIVIQVGLLMAYFSYIVYDSIMRMEYWAFKVYAYYAFPFQVIIPLILLLVIEIKGRKNRLQ